MNIFCMKKRRLAKVVFFPLDLSISERMVYECRYSGTFNISHIDVLCKDYFSSRILEHDYVPKICCP